MKVDELDSNRFEVALELFKEGQSFEFSGVDFYPDKENKRLEVRIFTSWELGNLTEQIALSEIENGQKVLNYLLEQSQRFSETIQNYQPRFSLIHTYGMGDVEICYLENKKLVWN